MSTELAILGFLAGVFGAATRDLLVWLRKKPSHRPESRCVNDFHVFHSPETKGRCACGKWLIAVSREAR